MMQLGKSCWVTMGHGCKKDLLVDLHYTSQLRVIQAGYVLSAQGPGEKGLQASCFIQSSVYRNLLLIGPVEV